MGYSRFWLKVADEESKCIAHECPRFCAKNATVWCMSDYCLRQCLRALLVGDIDGFLPSEISVSKYTAKIKIPSAQKKNKKQSPIGLNNCVFSVAQDDCS